MKRGLIVYLTDSESLPDSFSPDEALATVPLKCERSLLAAAGEEFFDIDGALHQLIVRGMQHVSCVKARLDRNGRLELFGEPLRLYG
jgi:hypothetical protein